MPTYRSRYAYAIALPARDEEDRIVACLKACHAAMTRWPVPGVIALVVNNSRDRTARRARDWARRSGTHVHIEEVDFPDNLAHAGSARRAAFDCARRYVDPDGYLLTTDADSRPTSGWVEANLRALTLGKAALVCGTFYLEANDYAQLPVDVRERSALEDRYRKTALELDSLLDPDPLNLWPFHGRVSGASLAMSAVAYDFVGGSPVVPCAEDRALARRFMSHDLPILYCNSARVITSGRLLGRARGGMADTMATRVSGGTHVCDETVEAAGMVWIRAKLRARLRAAFHQADLRDALLAQIGLRLVSRALTGFGALWAFVEDESPLLKRRRIEWAEMAEQLPHLEALRDKAKRHAGTVTPASTELVA